MKKALLIILLLLPFLAQAQIEFKDINGKWQEEKQTKKKGKPLDFKDTMRVEIRTDGFMLIRHNKGATIAGQAELENKKLSLQGREYYVISSNKHNLVLKDDQGISHYFYDVPEFTNSPVTKLIPGVESGKQDIAIGTVKGKWTSYKKTDPTFNTSKFYLKSIDFREDKGNGTYAGTATFNNSDSVYSTEAFIYIKGTDLVISSDEETFKAKVMKSDGEEMILQNGTIHYFMKQFGKK